MCFFLLDHLYEIMVYIRFHLPILLSSCTFVNSNINYKFIHLCSICLIFLSQIISSSSSSLQFTEHTSSIIHSFDGSCRNYIHTCYFRKSHHEESYDNQQQTDECRQLLILHKCLRYDTSIKLYCSQTILNTARLKINKETPKSCFTLSIYKTIFAQHLRSIAPSRTINKCPIFVLLFFTYLIYY